MTENYSIDDVWGGISIDDNRISIYKAKTIGHSFISIDTFLKIAKMIEEKKSLSSNPL